MANDPANDKSQANGELQSSTPEAPASSGKAQIDGETQSPAPEPSAPSAPQKQATTSSPEAAPSDVEAIATPPTTEQKSTAVDRIKARVAKARQKDKEEFEAQVTNTGPVPATLDQKSKKYVVNLDADMAKIWKLYHDGTINRDDLVKILMLKIQQENEGQAAPILQVLLERGWINQEQAQLLQTVMATNVTHYGSLPRSSQLDLVLGQQVIAHQLLSRMEVHNLLQVQRKLHLFGMQLTLEILLVASGLLPKDTLLFVTQKIAKQMEAARAEAQEVKQREEHRRILVGNKPKTFPVMLTIFLLFLLVIIAPLTLLYLRVTEKRITRSVQPPPLTAPQPAQPAQPPPSPPQPGMPPKQPIPPRPPQALDPKTTRQLQEQQMAAQGLKQWGDYWIKRQAHQVLARTWKIGKIGNNFPYQPQLDKVDYELVGKKRQPTLVIAGAMAGPKLPEEYRLQLVLELYHGLRSKLYLQKYFQSDNDNLWQLRLPLLARMAPGVYYLRIAAPDNLQRPFIQVFFKRQPAKIWWLALQIGKKELIQRYYLFSRDNIDQLLLSLWQHYQRLSELTTPQLSPLEQRRGWADYRRQLQQIDKKIAARLQEVLIPAFPELEQRLLFFVKRLDQIAQLVQQGKSEQELFSLRAGYELEYYQARLALPRKYDQLLALLQIEKLRYVPYR